MLTKEMDAFYHVFIDKFQALERELKSNQLVNSDRTLEFLTAHHGNTGIQGRRILQAKGSKQKDGQK